MSIGKSYVQEVNHLPTETTQSASSPAEDVLLDFARSQRKLGGAGLIYSDPNQQQAPSGFTAETRKRIAEYLKDVPRNEKNIRKAEFSAPGAGPQGLHLDSHAAGSGIKTHPYGSAAKYFPDKQE